MSTSGVDVSLVLTCHNDGEFLPDAIASVRAQAGVTWEAILVDDASTDDTASLAHDLVVDDPRFRMARHPSNRGLAAARNTGIRLARGSAIAFLDADDFFIGPRSVADRWAMLQRSGSDVSGVYCDWASVQEHDSFAAWQSYERAFEGVADRWPEVTYATGLGANLFIATAPLVRAHHLTALGGFREDLRSAEDFELWYRLLRSGTRFLFSGNRGVAYRQRQGSMVHGDPAGHAENALKVIEWMRRPLDRHTTPRLEGAEPHWAPHPEVPLEARVAERLLALATYAVLSGDSGQEERLRQLVCHECSRPMIWQATLEQAVSAACARLGVRGTPVPDRERARVKAILGDWIVPAA